MDSAIRVVMKKEEGTWSVSPACSLRKLNLDRASEGNGFGICVCVCVWILVAVRRVSRARNFIKDPFLG